MAGGDHEGRDRLAWTDHEVRTTTRARRSSSALNACQVGHWDSIAVPGQARRKLTAPPSQPHPAVPASLRGTLTAARAAVRRLAPSPRPGRKPARFAAAR
jgi:hypothetical protein